MISATSFTLTGVVNKFLTVLLNATLWNKHSSYMGMAAVCGCLMAGAFYEQAPMRNTATPSAGAGSKKTKKKSKALSVQRSDDADEDDEQQVLLEAGNQVHLIIRLLVRNTLLIMHRADHVLGRDCDQKIDLGSSMSSLSTAVIFTSELLRCRSLSSASSCD